MLQAALGGYYLVSSGITSYDDFPVYYESGFNIMSPLEIEVSKCDRFYILLRKRADDAGTTFSEPTPPNISVTVKDVTNGEIILSGITLNTIHTEWDSVTPSFSPLVVRIDNSQDVNNPVIRVRAMDCLITDTTDNSFISFRITVSDDTKFFHYLPVYINSIGDRQTTTAAGRSVFFRVKNDTDGYVLFSPYAYLTEVEQNDIRVSFSYPLGSIYYGRQDTYNDEEFNFSVTSYSHSMVAECISLINIPGFRKVAVLHVDSYMHTKLSEISDDVYVDIGVVGTLSDNNDTFRIYFTR